MYIQSKANIPEDLQKSIRQFKFGRSKTVDVLIVRINPELLTMEQDKLIEDIQLEHLQEKLPMTEPRYILVRFQYEKPDKRVVYPYCMILYAPDGCPPMSLMHYTASHSTFAHECGVGKIFELKDVDDLTDQWLKDKLEEI